MLIVQLKEEAECDNKKIKKRFGKKNNTCTGYPLRQSIKINNRPICVLNIREKDLENQQIQRLLNNYRGKVLVPEKNKELFDGTLLFDSDYYFQRALISSLIKQLAYVDAEKRCVLIKVSSFGGCDELYELVRISKKVAFCTDDCEELKVLQSYCYENYGAVVVLKDFSCRDEYGIVMDLDMIDKRGKLIIDFLGKNTLIYPDATFFYANDVAGKLISMGIDENTASAAADYLGVR